MYFQHEWDSERYAAGMKQLEDVVSPAVTCIFDLLTLLFSLTGISLHPLKSMTTADESAPGMLETLFGYALD